MAINNIDGIPFLWDNDAHLPLDERLKPRLRNRK
jgi:hypothetical protein